MFTKTTQEGRNARNVIARMAHVIRNGDRDACDAMLACGTELRAQGARGIDIVDSAGPVARAAFRSYWRSHVLAYRRPIGVL